MAHVQGGKRHQKLRAFLEKCHLMLLPNHVGSVPSIEDCSKLEVTRFYGLLNQIFTNDLSGRGSNFCHGTRTSVLCCGPEAVVEANGAARSLSTTHQLPSVQDYDRADEDEGRSSNRETSSIRRSVLKGLRTKAW
jgi:hypothetical protein